LNLDLGVRQQNVDMAGFKGDSMFGEAGHESAVQGRQGIELSVTSPNKNGRKTATAVSFMES
jgi:hypothetical protein